MSSFVDERTHINSLMQVLRRRLAGAHSTHRDFEKVTFIPHGSIGRIGEA